MNAAAPDPRNPMSSDVLAPFAEEWAERARKLQEAIDSLTAGEGSRAPRIERRRIGKTDRYVLVRRDGDEQRLLHGEDAKEVTVNFTPAEWAMVEAVVLLLHGLQPLSPQTTHQEGTK